MDLIHGPGPGGGRSMDSGPCFVYVRDRRPHNVGLVHFHAKVTPEIWKICQVYDKMFKYYIGKGKDPRERSFVNLYGMQPGYVISNFKTVFQMASLFHVKLLKYVLMYQSNRSSNIPLRAYSSHLTSFVARKGGNLTNLVFPGAGHLITDRQTDRQTDMFLFGVLYKESTLTTISK